MGGGVAGVREGGGCVGGGGGERKKNNLKHLSFTPLYNPAQSF